jgi:DNA invertase Pin-like site-specific DNA recombinase
MAKFIAYYRVSTQKQERSGLGLDAQREAVQAHVRRAGGEIVATFEETESGANNDRPALKAALAACRVHGAVLCVGKLDRLSRNVAFLAALMESRVDFLACDCPAANKLTLHVLAAVAENEREIIGQRTRAGMAAIKAKLAADGAYTTKAGKVITRLGGPGWQCGQERGPKVAGAVNRKAAEGRAADLRPIIKDLRARGAGSLAAIADGLNAMGVPAARGGEWSAKTVSRVLSRLS